MLFVDGGDPLREISLDDLVAHHVGAEVHPGSPQICAELP
jgi:hypothetical protein